MFADVPLFPEQASTIAPKVDAVFFYVLGVSVFFTLLIAVLVMGFAIKYRRRSDDEFPAPLIGSKKLEAAWIVVPFLLMLVMYVWGASTFFAAARAPDDALEVYVVGKQWMWKVQHPGGQREVNELHVPVGQPVRLVMASEDVIHSFFVPAFRVKHDVVPGRYTRLWFEATKVGRYHLFCAEYCGTEHSRMGGWVHVLSPDDYRRWLAERADRSMAQKGRALFSKLQCLTCHSADAEARAPVLEGLFGRTVPLRDARPVVADDNYLRESILKPEAKIVAGYEPIMPPFVLKKSPDDQEGNFTEEELMELIAYVKSLGRGDTPPRVEDSVPPERSQRKEAPGKEDGKKK